MPPLFFRLLPWLRSGGRVLALLGCLAFGSSARAVHFSGSSITWQCLGGNQYLITLDIFLDCTGAALIDQTLNISSDCGMAPDPIVLPPPVPVEVSQLCPAALPNSSCNGGPYVGINHYQVQTIQTLAPCDSWHITWSLCCRNNTVNLVGQQGMYAEAILNNTISACDDSPQFPDQTLQYVCLNQPVYYNPGANDPDGDHLVYSLIEARRFLAGNVEPVVYQAGYTGAEPVPGITIDPATGQLVFTPTNIGQYVVVMLVEEYDDAGNLIGSVMRDMIFVVRACGGSPPTAAPSVTIFDPADPNNPASTVGVVTGSGNSVVVCEGTPFCVNVTFQDADPGTVLQLTSQAAALLPGSTFTVNGSNPAVGTICWTPDAALSPVNVLVFANDGSCPVLNSASVAVNIITSDLGPPPDPGTNGTLQLCGGAGSADLFLQLGGTPDPGGTWTAPNGTVHGSTFNPATDAAGVYTYTLVNACTGASTSSTVTVTLGGGASAGTNGTLTLCANGPQVGLVTGLGGTPQGGGTWTGPGNVAHGPNYIPLSDAPGVYTYTLPATPGCPGASATVTVSEVTAPNAGTNGNLNVCENSLPVALFGQLMGAPQAGGTWTAPGGGPFGGSYDPLVNGPGIYTYTVPGNGPCVASTAVVTVVESPMPDAGTNGTLSICAGATATSMFAVLGGTPAPGGAWTTASGVGHGSFYDPATDVPGIFFYTVTGTPPCANAIATVTVTQGAAGNAGTDGSLNICNTAPPSNLFTQLTGATAGGTWTDPSGAAHSGTLDPGTDASGVYLYTLAAVGGCPGDQSQVTVTINTAPSAGTDGVLNTCTTHGIFNLFAQLTGAAAGGTWTAPGGAPHNGSLNTATESGGIYLYNLPAVGACAGDQSQVNVTISTAPNAGTDGVLNVCADGAATNLFAQLTGATAGGTWTDPGGAAHSGTLDPATDASGIYVYSLPAVGACAGDQSQVNVTISTAPNAGSDGVLNICSNGAASNLFTQLTGATAGGTWTDPSGAAHSGTLDPATDASGIYVYSLPAVGACAGDQSQVNVTISTAANAGTDGVLNVCADGAATNLFAQLTGATVGGTWTNPSGAAHSGTLDPATDANGIYVYSLPAVGACAGDQSQVLVTISTSPNAGTDGVLNVCTDGGTSNLFAQLTGATAGGTWTDPGGAAHSGTLDPATDASGVYVYSLPAVGACAGDQSQVNVTISTAPNAGADGVLNICSNGAASNLFTQLTGATAGGTWTDPSGAAHSGTLDPATDASGIYVYSLPAVGACAGDQSQVNVTISTAPNAGTDGVLNVCSDGAASNLFAQLTGATAGGTWTNPSGAAHSGALDPATDASGIYVYSLPAVGACAGDQSQVNVTISTAPNAGSDGVLNICADGAASNLFAQLTGAAAGGTWTDPSGAAHSGALDPSMDASGIYVYSLPAVGACAGDQSQVNVTISTAANAGTDGVLSICADAAASNLFAQLTGATVGGTWTNPSGAAHSGTLDPAVDASGTYTYLIAASGSCAGDQSQVVVTISTAANAGTDGVLNVCGDAAASNLFAQLTGATAGGIWTNPSGAAHSGTLDPAVDASGTYTYSIAASGSCAGDQSQVVVTISTAANAGTDGVLNICADGGASDLFAQLSGATAGGTWTDPSGAAHSGTLDPAVDASGTYTYSIAASGSCAGDQSQVVVTISTAANAGTDGVLNICADGATSNLFAQLTGATAGGTWTDPSGAAHSGTLDPSTDASGIYVYSLPAVGACAGDQSQVNVMISTAPNAGTDGVLNVCTDGAASNLFAQLTGATAGGTWTNPSGAAHSGTLDPAVDAGGTYTYSIAASGSCAGDQSQVVVTISTAANAGTDGVLNICADGVASNLFAQLTGATAGGTWTDPSGAAHSGALDPSTDASGIYVYSVPAVGACSGDQSQVNVTISTAANAGTDGVVNICADGGASDLFAQLTGAATGGTWTNPSGAAHSGTLDPAVDASGTYTYSIAASGSCAGDQSQVVVTISTAANAGTDGVLNICADGATSNLFTQLSGATAGGTWTDPSGAAHSGTLDPSTDASGIYVYSLPAVGACAGDQSQVNVTISTAPNAGSDGVLNVCADGAASNLFAQLTGAATGGTWTGPSGSAHSGTLDPSTDASGIYVYSLPAVGACAGDQSQVNVTISTAPNAGTDGVLNVCADGAASNLFAQLTGATAGGTWTGPSGSAHSGTLDPATDASGIYVYSLPAVVACAGDQSQVVVTISTAANAGADGVLNICADGATSNLFAQLTGASTGGTWTDPSGAAHSGTLDPAVDASGTYTYSIAASGSCSGDQSQVVVTISTAANAGTDGVLNVCGDGAASNLFAQLTGATAGGTWTNPSGAAHSGTLDPAVDASGTYSYSIAASGSCAGDQSQVLVTISSAGNAGTDGVLNVCADGATSNLFAQLTGATAGGTWTDPSGAAHSGTLDPAVDASGIYTYSIAASGSCAGDQSQVVVTISTAANAGTDGVLNICANGAASNLFAQLTGATAGGTWTNPSGAAHSGTLDPAVDASGMYTYSIAASGSCAGDQSQVVVTISTAANAGADGMLNVCADGSASNLFAQLTGATAGGTWTDPSGSAHSGTLDPAVDASGTYTYSIAASGSCGGDQSQVNVTISTAANAGTDGVLNVCTDGAASNLFAQLSGASAGGTWTDPSGAAHSGTLDPAVDASGIYTYSIAASGSCAGDQSQVLVTISTAGNAGTDGVLNVCADGGASNLFAQLTGAATGGTWTDPSGAAHSGTLDPAMDASGIYVYSLPAIGACAGDQSQVNVTISTAANAGTDGTLEICATGAAASLFAELSGATAGGTWTRPDDEPHTGLFDPANDPAGIYLYDLPASGACTGDQSQVTVTITAAPNAGNSAWLELCTGDAPVDLLAQLGAGAAAGGTWTDANGLPVAATFEPASQGSGIFTYTVVAAPCPSVTAFVDITVLVGPNAGQDTELAVCNDAPPFAVIMAMDGDPDVTGTWTGPDGLPFSGSFDPATSAPGNHLYSVPGNGACPQAEATITISVSQAVSAGTIGIATLCSSDEVIPLFDQLGGDPDVGGAWIDPAGTPFSGLFDPGIHTAGIYTYTVPAQAPCAMSSASITVEVNPAPDAGTSTAAVFCTSDDAVALFTLLGGTADAGGTWTAPEGAASDGTFDPVNGVPGIYTYTVSGIAPCASASSTVEVGLSLPVDAGADAATMLCINADPLDLFTLLGGSPDAGGTWYSPTGVEIPAFLDPATAVTGTYRYVVEAASPCADDEALVSVGIVTVPSVEVQVGSTEGCAPLEVTFTTSNTMEADYLWDFGPMGTSTESSPTILFTDAGTYTVGLSVDAGGTCASVVSLPDLITVHTMPTALFSLVPPSIVDGRALVQLHNESTGASAYAWDLGGTGTSVLQDPAVLFPADEAGVFTICLVAYASPSCADTVCRELVLEEGLEVRVPNAFTPDGDGINDGFAPVVVGIDASDYEFMIFDRWGSPLFRSSTPGEAWDGRSLNGDEVAQGVFIWKLWARNGRTGERIERIGHVTLVR